MTKSFTLITVLPDRVARWVGAGGENLGEESDHKAMTGGATNVIYTGAGQGGRGGKDHVGRYGSKAQQAGNQAEAKEDAKWNKRLGKTGVPGSFNANGANEPPTSEGEGR